MRRIYWDTMLLIYLLDNHADYADRVRKLLTVSFRRQDRLVMSLVGLGEVMAGAGKSHVKGTPALIRESIDEMGFSYLPFTPPAVEIFSNLRSVHRVKTADAIHLACAAVAGTDLFLTNDHKLLNLHVPGINFIAHFENPPV